MTQLYTPIKNKQIRPNETQKPLHSRKNHKENDKAHRIGENTCKSWDNLQNWQRAQAAQYQNTKNPIKI